MRVMHQSIRDPLRQDEQVVATEAIAGFPLLPVAVETAEGYAVAGSLFRLVRPLGGLDRVEGPAAATNPCESRCTGLRSGPGERISRWGDH